MKMQKVSTVLTKEEIEKIMVPKNDYIFKRLFGGIGREKIVKDFLEAILEEDIKSVKIGKETILLPEEMTGKYGVLDVRVTLDNGTEVDVEIQTAKQMYIEKRAHFYASRLYEKSLKSGESYKYLNKVIVIFILTYEEFLDIERYHTKWKMTETQDSNFKFNELELHFIELPKFLRTKYDKQRKIDQWLLFIDHTQKELIKEIMRENKNIKEADEKLEELKNDEHEQYLAWLELKKRLDYNTNMNYEYERGIEEGEKRGEKRGEKKGEKKGIIKVAKNLKKLGMSVKEIIQATGLDESEIEKL